MDVCSLRTKLVACLQKTWFLQVESYDVRVRYKLPIKQLDLQENHVGAVAGVTRKGS